jgi:outer membrane protein assembly factor BamB
MQKTIFLVSAQIVLLISQASLAAQEPRKLALLVGVSDYNDPQFDDLKYASDDVVAVGRQLHLMGFETTVVAGDRATRAGVIEAVTKLLGQAEKLESDSIVLLMFSGHGQQIKVQRGAGSAGLSRTAETPFFCPVDAIGFDPTKHDLRGRDAKQVSRELNLISLNSIIDGLDRQSNSRRNLLIVDACRSNPAKGRAAGISGSTAVDLPRGISILFAAGSGQKSWESSDAKVPRGVMTHFLLKGLRGEAKNRRAEITWSRLVNYIREEVEYDAGKLAGSPERKQSPQAIINDDELIVLNSHQSPSQSWNRFRGPNGSGNNTNAKIPLSWSETENVRWKVKLPGRGSSSPIVVDGKALITSYVNDEEDPLKSVQRMASCFDVATGELIWTFTTDTTTEQRKPDPRGGGYANNTLTADPERIYGWFGSAGVIAMDWSGQPIWKHQLPLTDSGKKYPWNVGSSPILYENLLILNAGTYCEQMVAFNKESGDLVWKVSDPEISKKHQTPIICHAASGDELIQVSDSQVSGLSPLTGEKLWHYDVQGQLNLQHSSVVGEGDAIYVFADDTLAIRGGGLKNLAGSRNLIWVNGDSAAQVSTPILFSDQLAMVKHGVLRLCDRATGNLLVKRRTAGLNNLLASPVATGKYVLFLNKEGHCTVFDPNRDWEIVATNIIQEDDPFFIGTPALLDDCLLIRSNQYLYCIGD